MSESPETNNLSPKPFTVTTALGKASYFFLNQRFESIFFPHLEALNDIIQALEKPENDIKLKEAKENAGNDMLKMMQLAFPMATQMQMEVLPKYGFTSDGDGLIRFTQSVKLLEKQNNEIATLNSKLRSILMPPLQCSLPNDLA